MNEKFLSQNVVDIPQSGIRKFFDIVQQSKDCLPLVVGEPDFITPDDIREAAINAIREGKTQYTSNWGLKDLRIAISKYMEKRFGLEYNPDTEIMATIGASEGIDLTMRALIEPGDEVLIPDPAYVAYSPCTRLNYGKPAAVKTYEKDGFKLTAENLEKAITNKSKVLVLPYPSNPTGAIMTKEELSKIVPIIIKHDLICVSDEIYGELTYGRRHVSIASFDGMKERTVLISGFSKSFAMTGWRVGYVCADNEILRQMIKIHQFTTVCPATMAQYACIAALENGMKNNYSEIEYMREKYNERREFMYHELNNIGLSAFEPQGAFYIFPNVKKTTGLNGQEFALQLLEKRKVATVPGDAFGEFGKDNIRISYAYSIENLQKGINEIKKFINC